MNVADPIASSKLENVKPVQYRDRTRRSFVTTDYTSIFERAIRKIRAEQRYRTFSNLERVAGRYPHAIWHSPDGPREAVLWCSNDYLGMGHHSDVINAMIESVARAGTGAGGTRNIAGTHQAMVELEREIADLHGKEAAGFHIWLCFKSDRNFDNWKTDSKLPDPVRRDESQLYNRGHQTVRLRLSYLPSQRCGSSRIASSCFRRSP